jgi:hypothetical protein
VTRHVVATATAIGGDVHARVADGTRSDAGALASALAGEPAALFEMGEAAEPVEKLSDDRLRTRRQLAALRNGRHPIGLNFGITLRLHPAAPPADDRHAPGPRCGTCVFRQMWGEQPHPKCLRGGCTFATHSAGSDVRAWWGACEYYEPVQQGEGAQR